MCPEYLAPLANRRGIALITAMFAIVILALFGLLITRYTVTTQTLLGGRLSLGPIPVQR